MAYVPSNPTNDGGAVITPNAQGGKNIVLTPVTTNSSRFIGKSSSTNYVKPQQPIQQSSNNNNDTLNKLTSNLPSSQALNNLSNQNNSNMQLVNNYNPKNNFAPTQLNPKESLAPTSTTRVFPESNFNTVVPTSEAFPGYNTPSYKIQKSAEELQTTALKNPSQAGFYNAAAFGVGVGSGVFNLATHPVETVVVAPIQAVTHPVETAQNFGSQLITNTPFFLGQQVGTGLALKGIGSGLKFGSDFAINKVFKFEPINVEGVQTRSESFNFGKNILTNEGTFSSVEASKSQGLFSLGNKYFKVTAEGAGKTADVSDLSKYFKGKELVKIQQGSYSDQGFFGTVGRPRTVKMSIVGTVKVGDESSQFLGFNKITGNKVNVNRVIQSNIKTSEPESFSGISFDVNKDFSIVKNSGRFFGGKSVKLYEESGKSLTGEDFTKTIRASSNINFETRPLENSYKDFGISRKDFYNSNDNLGTVAVSKGSSNVLSSLELKNVLSDTIKSIKTAEVSKSISKGSSIGVSSTSLGLVSKQSSKPIVKSSYSLKQSSKSLSGSSLDLSPKSVVSSKSSSKNIVSNAQIPKFNTKSSSDLLSIQKLGSAQDQSQLQRQVFSLTPVSVSSSLPFIPLAPVSTNIFPLSSLSFGGGSILHKKRKALSFNFKSRYIPTLEADIFNIHGREPKNYQSGLVLRPIGR